MENGEETKVLWEKRWISLKVRAFAPSGYFLWFYTLLAAAKLPESKCACDSVFKWTCMCVCTFKGRCLYQVTAAPQLMRFRVENQAVHFNSLASSAQRPAVQEAATEAELRYMSEPDSRAGLLSEGLQFQPVSLRSEARLSDEETICEGAENQSPGYIFEAHRLPSAPISFAFGPSSTPKLPFKLTHLSYCQCVCECVSMCACS